MMKLRLAFPEVLIDIHELDPELRYVKEEDGELRVGALARHKDLLESTPRPAVDPVCGISVEVASAEHAVEYGGKLYFGDTTLLGQVVRNANASSLDRIVVVLGRASGAVRDAIDFGRAGVVDNTAYGAGCASSLLAGLTAAGDDCEAIFLLLGDQPGVLPGFIDRARSVWESERPWVAVCSYRGSLGHHFAFSHEAFEDLRGLHGDKAVWKLIEAYPERVRKIGLDAALPPDVDTPEDYERALVHWREAS